MDDIAQGVERVDRPDLRVVRMGRPGGLAKSAELRVWLSQSETVRWGTGGSGVGNDT